MGTMAPLNALRNTTLQTECVESCSKIKATLMILYGHVGVEDQKPFERVGRRSEERTGGSGDG